MSTRTASRAHPKVQARRAAVARQRSRWRTRLLIAVTGLFTAGGSAWLAVQSSLLDLEQIEVRGARRVDSGAVEEAASLEAGEPLLLVDRGAVAERIEALPWVESAHAGWSLPGTLVVEVVERTPIGWVAADDSDLERDGAVALVDETGRVLDMGPRPPNHLMEIEHPHRVPDPGERLERADSVLAIAASVPDTLRRRVRAVRRAATGFVLEIDGVEIVRFGAPEDVIEKWSALEAVLTRLGDRDVHLVDVRVPSVPAVREREQLPRPEPAPPSAPESEGGAEPDAGAG